MRSTMSRRDLVIKLALLGVGGSLSQRAFGFPISRLLGPGSPGFVRAYLERMSAWYAREFFDLRKAMTNAERAYVDHCAQSLTRWDLSLSPFQSFERVSFSHRIEDGKANHARFAIGPQMVGSRELALARDILKARGLEVPSSLFGIGWDFVRDELKTYSLVDGPLGAKDRLGLEKGIDPDSVFSQRLFVQTFAKGREVDTKLIVAHRDLPSEALARIGFAGAVLSVMEVRRRDGERQWFYRLKSFTLDAIAPAGHAAALAHRREFAQLPDAILWTSPERYTLYYP